MKIYERLKGKKVIVFRKDKYKFEGVLEEFDERFLVIDDIKVGIKYIAVNEVLDVSEIKNGY